MRTLWSLNAKHFYRWTKWTNISGTSPLYGQRMSGSNHRYVPNVSIIILYTILYFKGWTTNSSSRTPRPGDSMPSMRLGLVTWKRDMHPKLLFLGQPASINPHLIPLHQEVWLDWLSQLLRWLNQPSTLTLATKLQVRHLDHKGVCSSITCWAAKTI